MPLAIVQEEPESSRGGEAGTRRRRLGRAGRVAMRYEGELHKWILEVDRHLMIDDGLCPYQGMWIDTGPPPRRGRTLLVSRPPPWTGPPITDDHHASSFRPR